MSAITEVSQIFTAYGSRRAPAAGAQMRIDARLVWDLLLEAEGASGQPVDVTKPFKKQILELQAKLAHANAQISSLLRELAVVRAQQTAKPQPPVITTVVVPVPKSPEKKDDDVIVLDLIDFEDDIGTLEQVSPPSPTMFPTITRDAEYRATAEDAPLSTDTTLYGKAYQAYLNGEISWVTLQTVAARMKMAHLPVPDDA